MTTRQKVEPAPQPAHKPASSSSLAVHTRTPVTAPTSPTLFDFGSLSSGHTTGATGHLHGESQGGGKQPPAKISDISLSTGAHEVHVPLMGISRVTASTVPANLPGITWSLVDGSAKLGAKTEISSTGVITFDPKQAPGSVTVRAVHALPDETITAQQPMQLSSHPKAIKTTVDTGGTLPATDYGGIFDHDFTADAGGAAALEGVPVGEKFPNLPDPDGTKHTFKTPFGEFTLSTKNLAATPGDKLNWFMRGGRLGGSSDHVSMGRAGINIGQFIVSASNPTPTTKLADAAFDVDQELHWFCWQDSTWRSIVKVVHRRALENPSTGPEFKVTVNGVAHSDSYTGHPGIIGATARPATIPPTTDVKSPSTTTISATTLPGTLPAGHALRFSLLPPALGCKIDKSTGLLTAGSQTGTVKVRVRDLASSNPNFDEVSVAIAMPQVPAPGPGGGAGSPGGKAGNPGSPASAIPPAVLEEPTIP